MKIVRLLILFMLTATGVTAQTGESSDVKSCAEKIHYNCRKCIYTVNAYSHIDKSEQDSTITNVKRRKWRRNVGTAIPIDSEGHLITCQSVVKDAVKVKIITADGEKIPADIIGRDFTGRIAVLKIAPEHIHGVPAVTSLEQISSGKNVYFLGVMPGMSVDVNCGRITSLNPSDGTFEVKTDSIPGTSGTPVFDSGERVLGLLAYKVDANNGTETVSEGNNYLIISLEHASVLAKQVIRKKKPKCGWLGICIDLTSINEDGILVTNIIEGSPAAKGKIQPQDRIYEYNGSPVRSIRDFSEAVTGSKAGDTIIIRLLRGSDRLAVNVTLSER